MSHLAQSFAGLSRLNEARMVFESPDVQALVIGAIGYLHYRSTQSAGAVGMCQGEAMLSALMELEDAECQSMVLMWNSAGAHFAEPLQGLFYLNAIIEYLGELRSKGIRVTVVSDGWLYGGAAMASAACADEIRLAEAAGMGLFGPKIAGGVTGELPGLEFQPDFVPLRRMAPNELLESGR